MSKHDIKQEYKQTEGDADIKSKQKQIARSRIQNIENKMLDANVVITNPTHYAVALHYSQDQMSKRKGLYCSSYKENCREKLDPCD